MIISKTNPLLAILAAGSLLLAGCQTIDPYTGESKVSKTAIGTGVGAAGGAIVGALVSGDPGLGAAVGAGVGGLTGAAVGNYMDKQESELRRELQSTGVQVSRHGHQINLIMPGNITFNSSSSDINAAFYPTLNSVAKVINKYNDTSVTLSGHTDSTGSAQLNASLSQQRANSVAQYLMAQGVNPHRVVAIGYGPEHPIATNSTPEGRTMNRRVEITLQPIVRQ